MNIRAFQLGDLPRMLEIWNDVVEEGISFPQTELLDVESGRAFFSAQTHTAVAVNEDSHVIRMCAP